MATQTASAGHLSWVPTRPLRVRVARLLAYLRARRALARTGLSGPQARILAREIAGRVRG